MEKQAVRKLGGHAGVEAQSGALDERYAIHWDRSLPNLESPFAKAYQASDKTTGAVLYALVFDPKFPVPADVLAALAGLTHPHLPSIAASGAVSLSASRTERFAVLCERLDGETLSVFVQRAGPLDERIALDVLLRQFAEALHALNGAGVVHGRIHPDHVYYHAKSGRMTLGECFSSFCGFLQDPGYETLDRLCCHPAGKGALDLSADYFALGMLLLFLLTGRAPFVRMDAEKVLDLRLQHGSYDAALASVGAQEGTFSKRAHVLLRGLLADAAHERWQQEKLAEWLGRKDLVAPASKLHRQALFPFPFDDREYAGPAYLAHDLSRKWDAAKKLLKPGELSRWAATGLKNPTLAQAIESIRLSAQEGMPLPDDKLARIIILLDPDGPVRLPEFASHVSGLGAMLAYGHLRNERPLIQRFGEVFHEGLVDFWIRQQLDPHAYTYGTLGWSPSKMRGYVRKGALGFGVERCLYEMNRGLPCQSPLTDGHLVTGLPELILALDKYTGEKENADPVDRHVAGYIASQIDLADEARIKTLQNFPHVSGHPQLTMAALLALAQSRAAIKSARSLSAWMAGRLTPLTNLLHSQSIRKELRRKLQQAAAEGRVQAVLKVVSDPAFVGRDAHGFREARRQYRQLGIAIVKQKKRSNIEYTAYQAGLRFAVSVAYLVCAVTMFYVLFKAI